MGRTSGRGNKKSQRLITGEEHYRELFENAPLPYQSLDANGNILEVNRPWLELLGYTREDVLGKFIGDFHTPLSRKRLIEKFPAFLKNNFVKDARFEFISKRGQVIFVSVNGNVQRDEKGIFRATHCILTNISEQRKYEDDLLQKNRELLHLKKLAEQSEEKYRLLVENQNDLIVKVDTANRFLYVSPGYCELFGKKEQELLGKSYFPLVHEEDREATEKAMDKLFHPPYRSYVEQRAKTVQGWRWLAWSTRAVTDDKGKVTGIIGVGRDIHDRMEALTALRESENRYRETSTLLESLFNVIPDVLGIQDSRHNIIRYNEAGYRFLGKTYEEVKGKKCFELIGRVIPCETCATSVAIKTKMTAHVEKYVPEMDMYLDVFAYPILDEKGEVKTIIEHLHDNTARKKAEMNLKKAKEKAEESDRLKSAFLANISHEIRTPMNAIMGFSKLLKDTDLSVARREDFIDIIQQSGNQLLSIIADIVEISRIETNQVVPNFTRIDLGELMDELFSSFKVLLPSSKVIELQKDPDSPRSAHVYTDGVKLRQIMTNLLGNSMKFTEKGYIRYGCRLNEKWLEFYVKDTGPGIPKEYQQVIFERFRQVDGDISIKKGGSGLGLAISKAYVEMLGGNIWLESEPGQGTEFHFRLPFIPVNGEG